VLVEKLRLHNFFAYASGPAKDALYRVQLGPYTTEEAASLTQSALEKAGFDAFVHTASESQ
jgi:cell division septation protein DedD